MMSFAYPWVFAGLLPAAAVIIYYFFIKKQPGIIVPQILPSQQKKRFFQLRVPLISGILTALALLLLIVAMARPQLADEKTIVRNNGIDMIMAIDLSGSMAAYDLPGNITTRSELAAALKSGRLSDRLQAAKNELAEFVKKRPNDRIGLIGFADHAYSLAPPTLDHDLLLDSLSGLEVNIIGNATGLASPVASAVKRLENSTAPRRVLVLFTDGVNTANHRLTPLETAQLAKEKNVIIYTVGIGGDRAVAISNGYVEPYSNSFDAKLLQDIAETTGGKYFHAADHHALTQVMDEINQLEKTDFEQPRYVEYAEYAPMLAMIAVIMLILAIGFKNTFERSLP